MNSQPKKIAVLIDAENANRANMLIPILDSISQLGYSIEMVLAFADWTNPSMRNWSTYLKSLAIRTIQIFPYSTKKNSSDIAMSVKAIEILFTKNHIDAICFVSSDGDFNFTAQVVREYGKEMVGIGNETTPDCYRKSCSQFISIDALLQEVIEQDMSVTEDELKKAHDMSLDKESGFARVSQMGIALKRLITGFDIHKTKYSSLSNLIKKHSNLFELFPDQQGVLWVKSK